MNYMSCLQSEEKCSLLLEDEGKLLEYDKTECIDKCSTIANSSNWIILKSCLVCEQFSKTLLVKFATSLLSLFLFCRF